MAKPTTSDWFTMTLWPGDGASPEDFTSKSCGLTSHGIEFSKQLNEAEVPDCDDPAAAVWTERVARALSAGVNGSGYLAVETFAFWNTWATTAGAKNVRIVLDLPGVAAAGYWEGSFELATFGVTGEKDGDGKIAVNIALSSNGPVAWVLSDDPGTP